MAVETVTALAELTSPAANDEIGIWDVSAGEYKKIQQSNLVGATITGGGTVALGGYTLTVPATGTVGLVSSGTWTPTLVGAGGNPTYTGTAIEGSWYRVGNMIFVRALISLTTYSGGSGALSIGGLPVAAANTNYGFIPLVGINVAYGSGNTLLYARVTPNSTELAIVATGSGVGATFLTTAALTGASALVLSGAYLV